MVVSTTSNGAGTARIAVAFTWAQARLCSENRFPAKAAVIFWSRLSATSIENVGGAMAAISRTSSWIGLPSVVPQVAFGWAIRRASCRTSTVPSPASPGATIFGPPLKPAKKCGSTNPVVILTSALIQARFRCTGTPVVVVPTNSSEASSRLSWLTTR